MTRLPRARFRSFKADQAVNRINRLPTNCRAGMPLDAFSPSFKSCDCNCPIGREGGHAALLVRVSPLSCCVVRYQPSFSAHAAALRPRSDPSDKCLLCYVRVRRTDGGRADGGADARTESGRTGDFFLSFHPSIFMRQMCDGYKAPAAPVPARARPCRLTLLRIFVSSFTQLIPSLLVGFLLLPKGKFNHFPLFLGPRICT